ncbi:hypothetical protein CDG60_11025 [Acinetobacter chinensis]|uniref:Uncharacterized protein n=1 Tax=Acinetobacter chinensis TaxID=2004650 RepID=A0A3B7M3A8_9GAMM|nr:MULTISPECIES: hypothetical protein [Acinetobacter]AXY57049.1 hypothetical protein CDG60_11025 [Acinetobacter chinensis]AXY60437.1 hypothetical protein CDG61_10615 [Acinetobacter sp. WCHAc010052]MDV2468798.1 hypothetical protein [Acinetobacter chinensis]WOE40351.1 hypothetical protein QSG87_10585 [Acinetobacter chinensis]
MLILIWGFILLLVCAVGFLFWLYFRNQDDSVHSDTQIMQTEDKVLHLEENLKKTLEIMQGLAKKMQVQQEVLDKTTTRLNQLELQNAELVSLLAKLKNL